MNGDALETGKERLVQVYKYLQALNSHRNPAKRQVKEQPWLMWLRQLPDHPSIKVASIEEPKPAAGGDDPKSAPTASESVGIDYLLRFSRPKLTKAPLPPASISDWIIKGWEEPSGEIRIHETRNTINEENETVIVSFNDDPERSRDLAAWSEKWKTWSKNERPAREAMRVFERFYELYGQMQREAERVELVLGDGLLNWRRADGGIHHPVILVRVQLEFDPAVPEFRIVDSGYGAELYSAIFTSFEDVDARQVGKAADELTQGGYHPLNKEGTSAFLKRFVQILSPSRGEFVDTEIRGEDDYPRVGRDAVLYLRSRTLGFATAIDAILKDLKENPELPASLLNIVGIETAGDGGVPEEEASRPVTPDDEIRGPDSDILLSKPANPEQFRIVQCLEKHGSVLVQGPPGTGKTHTIANLIGHLLSEGKSVLVTAHTTKALHVLRKQVVEKLQPLCVSVLENDLESREQLNGAIESIVERLSTSDEGTLRDRSEKLQAQREGLLARLQEVHADILKARTNEYRDVVIAGEALSPSNAARKLIAEKGANDWIPAPLADGTPCPLSETEVVDLYGTNATVTDEDEAELGATLPVSTELIIPEQFESHVQERAHLSELDREHRKEFWMKEPVAGELEATRLLVSNLSAAIEPLDDKSAWKQEVVAAGRDGGDRRKTWETLIEMIEGLRKMAAQAEELLLRHSPVLPNDSDVGQCISTLERIIVHLSQGGSLGGIALITHPSWRRLVRSAKVSAGASPSSIEHFRALLAAANLMVARDELLRRWEMQVTRIGGPPAAKLGQRPETAAAQLVQTIRDCLDWHNTNWKSIEASFQSLGFRWDSFLGEQPPDLSPNGALVRLRKAIGGPMQPVLEARINAICWRSLESHQSKLLRTIERAGGGKKSAQVVRQLLTAVSEWDLTAYRAAFQRLLDLERKRADLERRKALLSKLEDAAPAWAAEVRGRREQHAAHRPPGDPSKAWTWRQIEMELGKRAGLSLSDLMRSAESLQGQIRTVTADLIDARAWAAQAKRTKLDQRQALQGWVQIIRRIGKGTGKRVPMLQAEARRLLGQCRSAVPVWIMPLARVVESFDPQTSDFDVVIIDEASQADVMALIALYMGKKVVVVGDGEQVSPSAVGQQQAIVGNLIAQHLQGVPNAVLYDGLMSVYDLAQAAFGGAICLLEHFRCVPEIVQFSNGLSYNWRLKPLRDPTHVNIRPHVIAYRVDGSVASDKVNVKEAETVASLLLAAIEQPEYRIANDRPTTFGVISLVGEEQAIEIERILRSKLPEPDYIRHQILCGNAAQFQGDERDVVFLSVVDAGTDGPLRLRSEMRFKQRFNVAASRAKDQMWVVHSLDPRRHLQPVDLRRRLIEYAEDPNAVLRNLDKATSRAESEFEKQVIRRLLDRKYCVRSQWKVGYYRIDIVVEGGGKRLAIECDGDRFHPIESIPEDMARQAILERLGWTFVRIRGSHFFRDPDSAMKVIFDRLEQLEIPAVGDDPAADHTERAAEELKERVVRRAAEIRRSWSGGEESEADTEPPALNEHTVSVPPAPAGPAEGDVAAERPGQHASVRTDFPLDAGVEPQRPVPKAEASGADKSSPVKTQTVSDDLSAHIIKILSHGKPLKAKELASQLRCDRTTINQALYSVLGDKVEKIEGDRWRLKNPQLNMFENCVEAPGGDMQTLTSPAEMPKPHSKSTPMNLVPDAKHKTLGLCPNPDCGKPLVIGPPRKACPFCGQLLI